MKPILTVEGKQVEVYALFYRAGKVHNVSVIDENGVTVTYHDVKENTQYYVEKPLQIDFDEALVWQGKYTEVVNDIESLIKQKNGELVKLAINHIESENPFGIDDKKEYFSTQREIIGLRDALDIIDDYMMDDVDLSGGEEIE